MILLLILACLSHTTTNLTVQSLEGKTNSASLHGQIVDLFGHPIRKTLIQVELGEKAKIFTIHTDDQGFYEVEGLPEGKHEFTFFSRGVVTERVTAVLKNGGKTRVDIGFIAGYLSEPLPTEVYGLVLEEQGKSVENATVVLRSAFNRKLVLSANTDGQGRYKASAKYPGQYVVYAYKAGFKVAANSVTITASLPRNPVKMDFTLPALK